MVANIATDTNTLAAITARSQSVQGQLQASQATNHLLALVAKQQLEISQLMAAQYRAQSREAASRAQAEAEGRAAAQKFIGNGSRASQRSHSLGLADRSQSRPSANPLTPGDPEMISVRTFPLLALSLATAANAAADTKTTKRSLPSRTVAAANAAAAVEPASNAFIAANAVLPFVDGQIYHVLTAPEAVTDVLLQPGETLGSVAAGDTARWVIGDTTSGSGVDKRATAAGASSSRFRHSFV